MNSLPFASSFLIAILPALIWLFIYVKKDNVDPEPKKVILKTFLAGALIALPFLGVRFFIADLHLTNAVTAGLCVIVFAALEEVAKLSASIYVVSRHRLEFNQIIDGVVYAVTAALGFSFIENFFYFSELFKVAAIESSFSIIAFRSFGTMLAHTLFSALAGLIWAYAYFSKKITPFQKKSLLAFELKDFFNLEIWSLHIIRRNILIAHPSRRGGHEKKILVLEGIVLATILHSIYNLMTTFEVLGQSLTFLLVPALVGGFLLVSYLFTKKFYTKIYKVV